MSHMFSHLIHMTIWEKKCYLCLFQMENEGSRRSYKMAKVTEVVTGRMGSQAHGCSPVLKPASLCSPYPISEEIQAVWPPQPPAEGLSPDLPLVSQCTLTDTLHWAWVSNLSHRPWTHRADPSDRVPMKCQELRSGDKNEHSIVPLSGSLIWGMNFAAFNLNVFTLEWWSWSLALRAIAWVKVEPHVLHWAWVERGNQNILVLLLLLPAFGKRQNRNFLRNVKRQDGVGGQAAFGGFLLLVATKAWCTHKIWMWYSFQPSEKFRDSFVVEFYGLQDEVWVEMATLPCFECAATSGPGLYHSVKSGSKPKQERRNIFLALTFNSTVGQRKPFLRSQLFWNELEAALFKAEQRSPLQVLKGPSQRPDKWVKDKHTKERKSECWCVWRWRAAALWAHTAW